MAEARIIDGNAVAARLRERVAAKVEQLADAHGMPPGLATILVGDDPASEVYVRMKRNDSAEVGIESFHHEPGGDVSEQALAELILGLNAIPACTASCSSCRCRRTSTRRRSCR